MGDDVQQHKINAAKSFPFALVEAICLTTLLYVASYFLLPPPPPSAAVVSLFAFFAVCFAFGRRAFSAKRRKDKQAAPREQGK